MNTQNHIFIFGLGYVGLCLARRLAEKGWQISGTCRDPKRLADYTQKGWQILSFDGETPVANLSEHLKQASHLISSISALSGSDPVLDHHAQEIQAFNGWTGYMSATSVYPDQASGWVDETTPPAPATARGMARVQAETKWLKYGGAEIFRIAGIYGPGRNLFSGLRAGKARIIDKPDHMFNRIHLDDIMRIMLRAIEQPRAGRIINLCDEQPAPQGEVVRYAASLMGIPPPQPIPLEEAGLSEMARSFYMSRRQLRSVLRKAELGIDLIYPSYRQGLAALWADEKSNL